MGAAAVAVALAAGRPRVVRGGTGGDGMTGLRDSRITASGSVVESPGTGVFGYGVPANGQVRRDGSLAVTGGAHHQLGSGGGQGPAVTVGRGDGYLGTVVVADAGSRLSLSPGFGSPGATLTVGREGGDGALYVLSGASVAVGSTGPGTAGLQAMTVGRDAGTRGLVDLLGGSLTLQGATVALEVGLAQGVGRMRLLDDGWMQIAAQGGDARLAVGTSGEGRLAISTSAVLVQAGTQGAARLLLGTDGGSGVLDIDGAPLPAGWPAGTAASGLVLNGGTGRAPVTATIGQGGEGSLRLDGGLLAMVNRGASVDAALRATQGQGTTGDVTLTLGSGGGTGLIEAMGGAHLHLGAAGAARVEIGHGGTGTLRLAEESALRMEAGGPSVLSLGPGGRLLIEGGSTVGGARRLEAEGALIRLAEGGHLGLSAALELTGGARLGLDGGTLAVPAVTLQGGSLLAGAGLVTGATAGGKVQVTLGASTLRVGDRIDPGGSVEPGFGTLRIAGDLAKTGGQLWIDLGPGASDLLDVGGRLTLSGTEVRLGWQGGGPAPAEALIARAAGGVHLSGSSLSASGLAGGLELQLRAGGTELWVVPAGSLPPAGDGAAPVSLAGRIATRGGGSLEGAVVSFTPASGPAVETVATGGRFDLTLAADTAGRIDATLDAGAVRPSTGSALAALRLAVGLQPAAGPAGPLDFIAADITGDGRVGTDDALTILRLAVGLPASHAPRWVFLDAAADLSGITRSNVTFETGLWRDPASGAEPSLTAILVGDPNALG